MQGFGWSTDYPREREWGSSAGTLEFGLQCASVSCLLPSSFGLAKQTSSSDAGPVGAKEVLSEKERVGAACRHFGLQCGAGGVQTVKHILSVTSFH